MSDPSHSLFFRLLCDITGNTYTVYMARVHTGILKQTLQHTKRFQEIVTVLIRYGFTDYLTVMKLDRRFRFIRRMINRGDNALPENLSHPQLIRTALEELGPTFIKLGQLLSNRPDIVPPDVLMELTSLQDDVAPVPTRVIKHIIAQEFDRPCEEVFSYFADDPIASASIAQVHRVNLSNGAPAAVKVQRPNIWHNMSIDLDILAGLAGLLEKYLPDSRFFQPVEIVKEFRSRLLEEIDFRHELNNIQRFHRMFHNDKRLKIPRVFLDYSTGRVLTMEYIHGQKMNRMQTLEGSREKRDQLSASLTQLMLEQIFTHGFFHADPHPGNILIMEDGTPCFLDFGLVGELRPRDKKYLSTILMATVHKDQAQLSEALLRITEAPDHVLREHIEDDVYDLLERYVDTELMQLQTEELLTQMIQVVVSRGLKVPTSLLLFTKTMLLLDGFIRSLSPQLNPLQLFEPFVTSYLAQKAGFSNFKHETIATSRDIALLLRNLPRDTRELTEMIKHGKLKMHFHVEGMEPMRNTLDAVSYRLVFGLLLASVIISSSLVIHAKIPPLWNGVPILGITGFVAAGAVGIGYIAVLTLRYLIHLYRK